MAIDGSKINEVVRHIVRKLRQSQKLPSYNYCVVVRLHFWGGHTFNYKQYINTSLLGRCLLIFFYSQPAHVSARTRRRRWTRESAAAVAGDWQIDVIGTDAEAAEVAER